ncbi:helix-turn-helix DNA binding domain protein [Gordonia Phage Zitch]|uniref:Helix-turn-helix DNA binding domain protein n=1 Tax=Gordonia Phage Zitch TaxID=2743909 RepID=A0A7G3VC86_9CAUD|nr:DNA binding protein [Gordonia Phage Zitch]QKY78535.1 helix-turn-helix DNA binding domain protein [Gordonia Phage Zitch]
MPPRSKMIDLREFAELAGVSYTTMRKYHSRARRRRREAATDPTIKVASWMLPAPDEQIGQSPAWKLSTAQKWVDARATRPPTGFRRADA